METGWNIFILGTISFDGKLKIKLVSELNRPKAAKARAVNRQG